MSKASKEKKKQLYGKTNNALPEQDISQKVEQVLASRRGPREAKEEKFQKETKFVVLYKESLEFLLSSSGVNLSMLR